MLAVLKELFIVKNCYKFCWYTIIPQNLVVTLLPSTQTIRYDLWFLALLGFTPQLEKRSLVEHSSSIAPLYTPTLPSHSIFYIRLYESGLTIT